MSQNRQLFSGGCKLRHQRLGYRPFTDLEFLEGVMAHTAGCSIEVLQNAVKDLTSLTTLVDRDPEDQATTGVSTPTIMAPAGRPQMANADMEYDGPHHESSAVGLHAHDPFDFREIGRWWGRC